MGAEAVPAQDVADHAPAPGGRLAQVLELDEHGTRIVVYNLHLESRGFGGTRESQLREAMKDAEQYDVGVPVIVGGDFNTVYSIARTRELLQAGGFRICFEQKVRTHRIWGMLDWFADRRSATERQWSVARRDRIITRWRCGSDSTPTCPRGATAIISNTTITS